jgi:hypothetical protein
MKTPEAKKLKTIGYISKQMYYAQTKTIMSPELKTYTIPIDKINSWDIERTVYLLEDGTVALETIKDKGIRVRELFIIEKEENKPIINEGLEYETHKDSIKENEEAGLDMELEH